MRILALSILTLLFSQAPQSPWKPAPAPLMTRWGRGVNPDRVHPEYPRPQMVRKKWLNLNGIWEFETTGSAGHTPAGRPLPDRILVPFPVESALSGVGKQAERVSYRRLFRIPTGWEGQRVVLHFGAVDWETTVFVNGRRIGTHQGGFDEFDFDITDALKPDGQQELVVQVYDPTDAGSQPRGKQVRKPEGIYYTPTTGIWQTVWLEPVPRVSITRLVLTPDVDARVLRLVVEQRGTAAARGVEVEAVATAGGSTLQTVRGRAGQEIRLPVREPRLWSPADPYLYGLTVRLRSGNDILDSVESYFGMRKVEVVTEGGVRRIRLNGETQFQVGLLDQGFWPDGLYTAPSDDGLVYDIEMTKKLGYNTIRKHVKVEPARWYFWADVVGLVVWQDMPSGDNKTPESRAQYERELRRMVETRRNHPSVIMWVVFNEGWGQFDTERLTALVKQMDPSRLVNNASGWTDMRVGDVIDIHSYPAPKAPPREPVRVSLLGEFGGLGMGVKGHTWSDRNWGYQQIQTAEQLTARYESLMRGVWDLKEKQGLAGVIYTQTTDVETEANGLMTYDRALVKMDVVRVRAANQGRLAQRIEMVPTSRDRPMVGKFVFQRPPDGWMKPDFNDTGWREGPGGYGTAGTPGATVRTVWNGPEIWLRREFTLPEVKGRTLRLQVHHDEDVEIYLNGVLAATASGYTTDYEELPISAEAAAALKPGRNILAARCRQTGGGQYLDVGIVELRR